MKWEDLRSGGWRTLFPAVVGVCRWLVSIILCFVRPILLFRCLLRFLRFYSLFGGGSVVGYGNVEKVSLNTLSQIHSYIP